MLWPHVCTFSLTCCCCAHVHARNCFVCICLDIVRCCLLSMLFWVSSSNGQISASAQTHQLCYLCLESCTCLWQSHTLMLQPLHAPDRLFRTAQLRGLGSCLWHRTSYINPSGVGLLMAAKSSNTAKSSVSVFRQAIRPFKQADMWFEACTLHHTGDASHGLRWTRTCSGDPLHYMFHKSCTVCQASASPRCSQLCCYLL